MSLQSITNINVDFYDKKYILINAKQFDRGSRFLSVTCYNQGKVYPINAGEHSAYIRYKKADGHSVFNFCEIDRFGKIEVELTEQMLALNGTCYADLVIVNKGSAEVDDTGAIIAIDNASVLSTMTFCIDVSESVVNNLDVESSYNYDGLNDLLTRAEANYEDVVTMAQSWARGGTGKRDGENTNNAKYWAELAHLYVVGDLGDKIVTGIKCGDDTTYKVGFVDITAENVGAIPSVNIASVEEVRQELGI